MSVLRARQSKLVERSGVVWGATDWGNYCYVVYCDVGYALRNSTGLAGNDIRLATVYGLSTRQITADERYRILNRMPIYVSNVIKNGTMGEPCVYPIVILAFASCRPTVLILALRKYSVTLCGTINIHQLSSVSSNCRQLVVCH